jgi:Uma2 family endonuclease
MVATPLRLTDGPIDRLEDYEANVLPTGCFDEVPEGMEWVDGQFVAKIGMTLKHASAQSNLAAEWRAYSRSSLQGGKTYVEALCQTLDQKRRPDVAYMTPELFQIHGEPATFPLGFPLVGEIASPDDSAEMLLAKAREYLAAGTEEVWILLPEAKVGFIVLADRLLVFSGDQTIATQRVLVGFSIGLAELFG